MSDNKDNNKKGFFSRLFGGSNASVQTKTEVTSSEQISEIPSISALNKMKKADIVSVAKDNGLGHYLLQHSQYQLFSSY